MSVQNAIKALEQLENTSSRKEKIEVLKENQGNEVLKEILLYTFNEYWVYGIKKIDRLDMETEVENDLRMCWGRFKELLDKLRNRKLTGNKAIEEAKFHLEQTPLELRKWLRRILFRELQAGVQVGTVNKVFKNMVPQYNVILASKDKKHIKWPCFGEVKYDGFRCNIYVHQDGRVEMITRNGKVITGFNQMEEEAKKILPRGMMFDGELMGETDGFKGVSKLAMADKEDKSGVIFMLYDMVPIWFMQSTSESFRMAFERRRLRIEKLPLIEGGCIRPVESRVLHSMDKAEEMFDDSLSEGFEGLIFKNFQMNYEKNTSSKRCKDMIKLKPSETLDLEIIGFEEEKDVNGSPKGTLGALVIDYKGHEVRVGSGLKMKNHEFTRDEIWNNQEKYMGKTAEIEYDNETSNKDGGVSLRFPRFITIRHDK